MKTETGPKDDVDAMKEVEQKVTLDDWAKNLKLVWTSDKQS